MTDDTTPDSAPILDPLDYVSAFMGLPVTVQQGLISAAKAAEELSDQDLNISGAVLKKIAEAQDTRRHFLEMCAGITTTTWLARRMAR